MALSIFDELPNELLVMVLINMAPADFVSMICASSRCLRMFKSLNSRILEPIVRRAIQSENLQLACAVCAVPFVASPIFNRWEIVNTPPPKDKRYMRRCVRRYFNNATSQIPTSEGEVDWGQLLKLCHIMDYFIAKYSSTALMQLQSISSARECQQGTREPTVLRDNVPELSDSERMRLQRAFLRYELCRRIYTVGASVDGWDMALASEKIHKNIRIHWRDWEIDEVVCVVDYVQTELDTVFGEVQRYLTAESKPVVEDVERSPMIISGGAASIGTDPVMKPPQNNSCFQRPSLRRLLGPSFLGASRKKYQIQSMAAVGLPNLRYLQRVGEKKKASLASYHGLRDSLHFAEIFQSLYIPETLPDAASKDLKSFTGLSHQPNQGWLATRTHNNAQDMYSELYKKPESIIAKSALLFWDQRRLEEFTASFSSNTNWYEQFKIPKPKEELEDAVQVWDPSDKLRIMTLGQRDREQEERLNFLIDY